MQLNKRYLMNRRILLKSLAAATVAAPVLQSAFANQNEEEQMVDYLFVQHAEGVTIDNGFLRLKDVAIETLYFSDRPERIVGRVTTQEFVDHWSTGDDSFKEDPPNAVVSILHHPEPQDVVVVLSEPELEKNDLVYNVEILDGNSAASGEASALFIDVIGRPLTPLSFAGMSRRTSRRTARRVSRRR
jgi:hypothetical protein